MSRSQGNADLNYSEIPPPAHQNGYLTQEEWVTRTWEREPHVPFTGGNEECAPQNMKTGTNLAYASMVPVPEQTNKQ